MSGPPPKPSLPSGFGLSNGGGDAKPPPPSRPTALEKPLPPTAPAALRPMSSIGIEAAAAPSSNRPLSTFDMRPGGLSSDSPAMPAMPSKPAMPSMPGVPSSIPSSIPTVINQPSSVPTTINRARPASAMVHPLVPDSINITEPIAPMVFEESTSAMGASALPGPPQRMSVPSALANLDPVEVDNSRNLFAFQAAHGNDNFEDEDSIDGSSTTGSLRSSVSAPINDGLPTTHSQTTPGLGTRREGTRAKMDNMKRKSMRVAKTVAKGGTEALETIGVKEKDKAKNYVRAVFDRLRNNDPTLNEVQLSQCRLGKSKLQELEKCLQNNTVVRKIDLSNRGVSDPESNLSTLTRALHDNPYITWIDVRNNGLGGKAVAALEQLLKVNLNLSRCDVQERVFVASDRAALARSLQTIQWLTHSNYGYQRFRANQNANLILSGRSYKQLVSRLLEGAERVQLFDCSYNELVEFPEAIEELQQVRTFLASHNMLTEIPGPTFAHFEHLVKLNLSHNKLTFLPDEITELVNVEEFSCSHNALTDLPLMFHLMSGLKRLDLSNNAITQLPPELNGLALLEVLLLNDNEIAFLPDALMTLATIKVLNLARNKIITMPDEEPDLPLLEVLDLSNNELVRIPEYVGTFSSIMKLNLSFNRIAALPDEITALKNMQELYVNNNNLTALPEYLGNVFKLVILHCQCNRITALPDTLQFLRNLKEFDASQNKIKVLHEWLSTLVSMENIDFRKNDPLKGMPSELLEKKPKEGETPQLDFIRQLPLVPILVTRMRLMIVGKQGTGKTSLTECLRLKSAKIAKKSKDVFEPKPTEGIAVQELGFSKGGHDVRLSTWDFSGNKDYYNTHQLFLNERSIFLVVCNMMDPASADAEIERWLELITRTAGEDVPTIIVGTHLDEKTCGSKYRKQFWARVKGKVGSKFKNIISYEAVSARHNKKIDGLVERILKTAMARPYMPQQVMRGYRYLEERIALLRQLMKTPMTSYKRFHDEVTACGVSDEKVEDAMQYLNDTGLIVYFQDVCDSLVFLDCQWIVDLISTFNKIKQFAHKGMVDRSELQNIWDTERYPEKYHEYILMLLERFDLCTRLTEQGKIFFAELLEEEATPSQATLNMMWSPGYEMEEPEFRRNLKYNFITTTLFPRVAGKIVHSMGWEFSNYWKNGAILRKPDGGGCFMRMDPNAKQLYLTVRGEVAADDLLFILQLIEQLNQSLGLTDVEEFVPCTHCLLLEEDANPYIFALTDFHNALNEGKEYVLCQGEVAVKLRALLPHGTLDLD